MRSRWHETEGLLNPEAAATTEAEAAELSAQGFTVYVVQWTKPEITAEADRQIGTV